MYGWLVVNHFLRPEKFDLLYSWLESAAEKRGHRLVRLTNAQAMFTITNGKFQPNLSLKYEPNPDYVIFWDKDVGLARMLESRGLRLFNKAESIAVCDDKSLTHICLANKGIRMPKTIIAPMTFSNIGYNDYFFLETVTNEIDFPIVVKECHGSFGQQVYLAKDKEQLIGIVRNIDHKPMLFQELISSSWGKDIRINVVGGKPVASMLRYSDSDFRSNISNGGRMQDYKPTEAQLDLAIKACEALSLDFAGVDILFGENDQPILCEVNSGPQFKSTYDCTGVNVADFIIDHISREMRR